MTTPSSTVWQVRQYDVALPISAHHNYTYMHHDSSRGVHKQDSPLGDSPYLGQFLRDVHKPLQTAAYGAGATKHLPYCLWSRRPAVHCMYRLQTCDGTMMQHTVHVLHRRFQGKFKHLWDAAERSVRSADNSTSRLETPGVAPGPLEQALSARQGDLGTAGQQSNGLQSKKSGVEGSRASVMSLTGRLGSLFPARKGSDANYQHHKDDLDGYDYMHREY